MLRLLGILALGNLIFGGRHDCCHRRGSALGSLLILFGLMYGGWIVVAVAFGILGLIGTLIGGIFSGLSYLLSGISSVSSVALGIVIGVAAYYMIRRRNAAKLEEE